MCGWELCFGIRRTHTAFGRTFSPLSFCTTTLWCPKFDPRHFRQHPRRGLLISNPDALSNMCWAEAAVMCNDGGDVSPVVLGIYFQPQNR